jgi:sulfatase modifying factor 1
MTFYEVYSGNLRYRFTTGPIMIRLSFKTLSLGLAALACLLAVPAGAAQITYDMVTVGNPDNVGDTRVGANTFGKGSVNYSYQIGKYDVTIGQYTAFLNAVAATDTYSLYNTSMGTENNIRGISRSGVSGEYVYSVIGPDGVVNGQSGANRPITYVSWFDAARFANWMTNGQGNGSTETGAYTLNGATTGNAVTAELGAAFRLPTENEWYKAAYYSPNYGGSDVGGYYAYATQSDTAPGNQIGSTPNQANYFTGARYSVTQSGYDPNQNYLTDVGAFTGSGSFYGTFDQSGNVNQWNDLDGTPGLFRGGRGGDWDSNGPFGVSSSYSDRGTTSDENWNGGFRLASPVSSASPVPEIDPNSLWSVLALVLGSLGLLERRRLKAA